MNNLKTSSIIIWVSIFSIAMVFLETAVVVYLRVIYYPEGFDFPLEPIHKDIAITEFWREIATLVMLLSIGFLAGKSKAQRLAYFLISFAIWDIFYYIFFYILLGWPQSIFTWDILFLIPVPWVGPVITPVIIAFLMIFFSGILIKTNRFPDWQEILMLIFGSIVVIYSWILDFWNSMQESKSSSNAFTLKSKEALFEASQNYVPNEFNWWIFWSGTAVILLSIIIYDFKKNKSGS